MWLFLKILGFIFLLGVIFGSQNQVRLALEKARAKLANQPTFVFDSRFLRSISLGHDLLLADLIWLDAVQYIGGHARNMNLDVLYQYLDTVTDLDPRFVYAYQVGELLLPQEGRIDLAVLLARKGMKNNPERWELPFYLGFIYHYYARDYELAAKYYALAARKEGAPLSAQTLAASAQMKGNKHQTGLITWQIILETTDNLALQRLAANRVERKKLDSPGAS
jgi:tetratricopeptide (TPR) repeat protein